MMSKMYIRTLAYAASALLVCGAAADAATFSMTGNYRDQRGAIELPLPPGLGQEARRVANVPSATVSQMGAALPGGGPNTIVIPPLQFGDNPTISGGFLIPVPSVVQLNTTFNHNGPTIPATLMGGYGNPGGFAFCPGATANPSCTTAAAAGTQGTLNGIVKYTPGPNKFGGTFNMLLTGGGNLVSKGMALPSTVMTAMGATIPALPFSVINNPLGGGPGATIAAGASYGLMQTAILGSAPNTHPLGYMTTTMGLITTGPSVAAAIPGKNSNTGFPFTTGVVYVYRQLNGGAQSTGMDPASKHTITGYDSRTAGGNGRVQLVSASLSRNYPSDGSNNPEGSVPNRSTLVMNLVAQPALPLTSPAMLLTLGSLVLLSAGFAVSRKRAS